MEEKLEQGVVVQQVQAVPGAVSAPAKPKPQLPKAIPADIQEIVSRWASIAGNADSPMKIYLKGARLSLGGDNRLLVVLEDGIASDYFLKHPENKEQLERLVTDYSGKTVDIQIQTVSNEREFEQNYVDLSKVIHMEVEEED